RPLHGLEPGPDDPGNGCFGPAGLGDLPDKCSSPTPTNWERSRMLCTRALRDKYLWLRLVTYGGTVMNVVVEVLRCRPIGMFYDIGAKFAVLGGRSSC
ncbi:MAG: hypothetical protein O3C40_37790, partial [Planctomycetota bacterium]|nr:hypothetical protein [Planctomycetota bacterium]